MEDKPKYDASNIKVLSWKEAIRKRPGMYIGDTNDCSSLVFYVFDSLKLAVKKSGEEPLTSISILIKENNWVEIKVNGNGLPVDINEGSTLIEKLMTQLHHNYTESYGGNHISDLCIVNTLSSQVDVTIVREGIKWMQSFKDGDPLPLKKMGRDKNSGILICFIPNKKYFTNMYFNRSKIATRLEELSYLYDGLNIDFEDRSIRKAHFKNPRGLVDYIDKLIPDTKNCKIRIDPIQIIDTNVNIKLKATLVFSEEHGCQRSFVNNEKTIGGGVHQKGLIAGIAQTFKVISGCNFSAAIWKPIIEQGLISVLSVHVSDPQWSGSTKDTLINKNIFLQIKSLVVNNLLGIIKENEAFRNNFKKLFVNSYLIADYRKKHEKYGLPTSSYVRKILKDLFQNPIDYEFIIKEYIEFERLSEECLKHQAE